MPVPDVEVPVVLDRQVQAPGVPRGRVQDALPDARPGQVDRDHLGAPAQQRGQRPHLGPGPEDHHPVPGQGQPPWVVGDPRHGLGAGRLDDRRRSPSARAAAAARRPAGARPGRAGRVRARPAPSPLTVAVASGASTGSLTASARPTSPSTVANVIRSCTAARPSRAIATAASRRAQTGLDQPPEVHAVLAPPGRLPLGRPGAHRVHRAQRVGDHRAGQGGGAAAGPRAGEDDAALTGAGGPTAARVRRSP